MTTETTTHWLKARASAANGDCVEQRRRDEMIEIRDSKNPGGPVLRFTPNEFTAWLDGARNGEFDHLV